MAQLDSKTYKMLAEKAALAREKAYAPYSKFKVGAAVLGEDGNIYTGCNIENVSYGLTVCAERTAIFKMVSEGCTKFKALAVYAGEKPQDSVPCGACRQVMCEFCEDFEVPVILSGSNGEILVKTLSQLCPMPFASFEKEE